jgi:hypothetical protein
LGFRDFCTSKNDACCKSVAKISEKHSKNPAGSRECRHKFVALSTFCIFGVLSTNVVDYSRCVVASWRLEVLVVVDVVDVVDF